MRSGGLLIVVGTLLLLLAVVDVLWTVVSAGSGAGPLAGRLSAGLWRLALAVGRRPDGPRHGFLAACGMWILVGVFVVWVLIVWSAWSMIFSATETAVQTSDGKSADLLERVAFAGSNVFTLGSADLSAGSAGWRLATIGAAATGLVFCTLSISYLVPVAAAVGDRRQLAAYISSLGETPERILTSAWKDGAFGSLGQHLVALTPMVHLIGERHLTYPVLHYFHSASERTAASMGIVVLDDAVTLLRFGVAPEARLEPATVESLSTALEMFLGTLESAFVSRSSRPLPAPDLALLRDAGIPTVRDEVFTARVAEQADRRRLLAGLLRDDGWSPSAWDGWRDRHRD